MIIDACSIPVEETIDCDICIVGAGIAGITLAHELRHQNIRIILLESGTFQFNPKIEKLGAGEVDLRYHDPLEDYRTRQFGGTSAVWGGRCAPFDALDFEYRPFVPLSGWCLTRAELDSYYARSHDYCDLGRPDYAANQLLPPTNLTEMVSGLQDPALTMEQLYLFSKPTHFGKKYLEILKQTNHLKILINATVLNLIADEDGKLIRSVRVSSLRQNPFSITAKQFVLAAGGLEVTRLLLLSNQVHQHGIGNHSDFLGRCYMGHLNSWAKVQFQPEVKLAWDYELTTEGVYCQRAIAIPEEQQQKHQLLNQRAFVERPEISDPCHGSSILSGTYLAKAILRHNAKHIHLKAHLKNLATDFTSISSFAYKWITQRVLSERKLPSVIAYSQSNCYTLRIDSEQVPNPQSRVTLSDRTDLFGLRQLKVDWQHTDLDIESIRKSVQLIDQALTKSGVGRVVSPVQTSARPQGGHHLGTTRMADNPNQGVVDRNCQVFGVHNLYIASSSVFTTASYANPTLTIVALAIRLADHLKSHLQHSSE